MGRRRTTNRHLPERVYLKHGAYYFVDFVGKWIPLGKTPAEMYRKLSELMPSDQPMLKMNDVFDRFIREKLPLLAPRTQSDYLGYIENLRPAFGEAPPADPAGGDVFEYRNERGKSSRTQANREKSCLSSVFTAAIEWKLRKDNPCRLVPKLPEPERTRYVHDEEYIPVYRIASDMIQIMMDLATMAGKREGDLLGLPMYDPRVYTKEGILFRPGKSKRRHPRHGKLVEVSKQELVEWSPDLHAVVDRARAIAPQIRPTLICTEQGKRYTESGFRSNWHRLMTTATKGSKRKDGSWIQEPVTPEWFTFHDLRAKRGSDSDDIVEAFEVLGHDDMKTTQKIYRRKPRRARAGRKILDNSVPIRQAPTNDAAK